MEDAADSDAEPPMAVALLAKTLAVEAAEATPSLITWPFALDAVVDVRDAVETNVPAPDVDTVAADESDATPSLMT